MPEIMRTIAARLRHFVADRRSAKRFAIRLNCTVGLAVGRNSTGGAHRDSSLEGYTCDVSASGLGLLMPAIHIDGDYLTTADSALLILLELRDAPILLHGVAVRYERIEEDETVMKYRIGLRIVEISDHDRERLVEYIKKR